MIAVSGQAATTIICGYLIGNYFEFIALDAHSWPSGDGHIVQLEFQLSLEFWRSLRGNAIFGETKEEET